MQVQEDSFEEYKNYLEEYIHDITENVVKPPKQPFNAYMHFVLDKSSAERIKNPAVDWGILTVKLADDWKRLKESERLVYEDAYERRVKEREKVLKEYYKVSNTKKIPTPYIRFFKRLYPIYVKKHKPSEVSNIIVAEWKAMNPAKKQEYIREYESDRLLQENKKITPQDRDEYAQLRTKYEKAIDDERNKIARKTQVAKALGAARELKKAQNKAQRLLQKANRKAPVKQEDSDSDSEKVEDLVKRVKANKKNAELAERRKKRAAKALEEKTAKEKDADDKADIALKTSRKRTSVSRGKAETLKEKKGRSVSKSPKATKMVVEPSPKPSKEASRKLRGHITPSPVEETKQKKATKGSVRKATKVPAKPAPKAKKVAAQKQDAAPVVRGRKTKPSVPAKPLKTKKIQKPAKPVTKVVKGVGKAKVVVVAKTLGRRKK